MNIQNAASAYLCTEIYHCRMGGRVCKVCGFPVFAFGADGNFGKKGGAVKNHTT